MKPVFICGHIKTGTSLLASLLDDHPQLSVFPEELFLFSKYNVLKKNKQLDYEQFWDLFFNDIQIKKMFGDKSNGLFGNVDYSAFDAKAFRKMCIKKTQHLETKDDFIFIIYETILSSFNELTKNDNKRWVEKTPMNEFYFHYWLNAYPQAQFIYMKRDPFEVFSSIKKKRIIESKDYSVFSFLTKYKTSLKLANKLKKQYPKNFKIIELEELKKSTQITMKDICNYLNVNFTNTMLTPTKLGIEWKGNSMFSNNNTNEIDSNSYYEKRLDIISEKESTLIKKYLQNEYLTIFDYDFINYSFKSYIKVIFPNLWLFYFFNSFLLKQKNNF